jgi:predicted TIM-barrel fold metal-dependent hydrolase
MKVKAIGNKTTMGNVALALIFGGVTEAHPNLQFLLVEGGIGWVAFLLDYMDHNYAAHHRWIEPKMSFKPSDYWSRQFHATFEDDRAGVLTLPMIDPSTLMWGSDYPHTEGVFPESQDSVDRNFQGLPESTRHQIVFTNAKELYGITTRP